MICVHPNGKHIFWAKLVNWNAKNQPHLLNIASSYHTSEWDGLVHLHGMLSDRSALSCPGGSIFQISCRCLRETTWKERNWIFLFLSPWMTLFRYKLIFKYQFIFQIQQNPSPCLSQGLNLVKLDISHCGWLHILLQKLYHLLSFIYTELHIHFSTEAGISVRAGIDL